jgi:hypothetical protein
MVMPGSLNTALNAQELFEGLKDAATASLGSDIEEIQGFAHDQLQAIAQQGVLAANGLADGSINDANKETFLDGLKEMVGSFLNVLAGLTAVVVEKMWNSMVGVIWGAINKATGLALVVPTPDRAAACTAVSRERKG